MTVLGKTNFEAALVDLDGTMIDTVGDFVVALGRALADIGCPPVSADFIRRTVGRGSEHLVAMTLVEVGAPPTDFDALWPRYQHHYLAINGQHAPVFPGVVEGLQALRARGLKLVCLTNKPTAFTLPLLAAKGLTRYFEHVFGGEAFERKKPDPLPLLKACEALAVPPGHTLMIGDSSNDARDARAAGCPVVLVSYGYNHGEPAASAQPDAVIGRLDEIPALMSS
jgi:phosphoglycolate phosphatase